MLTVVDDKIVADWGGVPDALKARSATAAEQQRGADFFAKLPPAMKGMQGPLANVQQVSMVAAALEPEVGAVQAYAIANWLGGLGSTSSQPSAWLFLGPTVAAVAANALTAAGHAAAAALSLASVSTAIPVVMPVAGMVAMVGGLAYFGAVAYEKFKPGQYLDVMDLYDMTAGYKVKVGGALLALKKQNPVAHAWAIQRGFAKALRKKADVEVNADQAQKKLINKLLELPKSIIEASADTFNLLTFLTRNAVPIAIGTAAVVAWFKFRPLDRIRQNPRRRRRRLRAA